MKHKASQELYDYWNRLRGEDIAPLRSAIEPSDIRRVLADTFIAEANGGDAYPIRLAGTRVCAVFGAEIKGRNLLDFWSGEDRRALATLMTAVSEEGAIAVLTSDGFADTGDKVPCELLILPLRHGLEHFDRLLGCFAPLETPYWLGTQPVVQQRITGLRLLWPSDGEHRDRRQAERGLDAAAALNAPARRVGGRRPHLYVVDGGKR